MSCLPLFFAAQVLVYSRLAPAALGQPPAGQTALFSQAGASAAPRGALRVFPPAKPLPPRGRILPAHFSQRAAPPLPYHQQLVRFRNPAAGNLVLAGTLTLPAGPGPFAAVVLVSGSGPQNRDEEAFGHRPFQVLADYLTRRGVAVLRYDDRGVGQSQGVFAGATTADFTTDAVAALAYLRQRRDIRPQQVGLVGHSEGGLIGWVAAAQAGGPDFLVSLAGPGLPGTTVLLRQLADLARRRGVDSTRREEGNRALRAVMAEVQRQPVTLSAEELLAQLTAVMQRYEPTLGVAQVQQQLRFLTDPWMRYFLLLDPAPYLAQVHCPVLVLNGAQDEQVAADQNVPAIVAGLQAAHNHDVTTRILPELNHFFQRDPQGTGNYAALGDCFPSAALQLIGEWVVTHTPFPAPSQKPN